MSVTQYAGDADLGTLFRNRAIGTLTLFAALWRLHRAPEPSALAAWRALLH
jgi:hypothetical protein